MITADHIIEFWESVHAALQQQQGIDAGRAWTMINRYRATLESRHIGDIVYHEEPARLAEGIASGWTGSRPAKRARSSGS